MEIFKVMAPLGTALIKIDAIEHEGAVWLIPKWLICRAEGWRQPERLIRADQADLQSFQANGCRYLLQRPISRLAVETATPLGPPATVVLAPELRFPLE